MFTHALHCCCRYDCGFHVLLYIQRYGRSDMYGIDTVSNMLVK
jgi:hypothetical protein